MLFSVTGVKYVIPDGKMFGKGTLHVKTRAAFTSLTNGYRHEFDIVGQPTRLEQLYADLGRVEVSR